LRTGATWLCIVSHKMISHTRPNRGYHLAACQNFSTYKEQLAHWSRRPESCSRCDFRAPTTPACTVRLDCQTTRTRISNGSADLRSECSSAASSVRGVWELSINEDHQHPIFGMKPRDGLSKLTRKVVGNRGACAIHRTSRLPQLETASFGPSRDARFIFHHVPRRAAEHS
jgi:hypothetical protein